MNTEIYQTLDQLCDQGDKSAALDSLVEYLESQGMFHELFEALKMKLRHGLGLAAAQAEPELPLDDATENQLEQGLIAACRRVGEAFLQAGKIRGGWMYLRPVGDRQVAAAALASVEVTDENFEDLINVQLHEGVDIARGYALSLNRLVTCNFIAIF